MRSVVRHFVRCRREDSRYPVMFLQPEPLDLRVMPVDSGLRLRDLTVSEAVSHFSDILIGQTPRNRPPVLRSSNPRTDLRQRIHQPPHFVRNSVGVVVLADSCKDLDAARL